MACWSLCKSIEDCTWFSYNNTDTQMCNLFTTCPDIETEEHSQFLSGQKECEYYCKLFSYFHLSYQVGLTLEILQLNLKSKVVPCSLDFDFQFFEI